jgi:IclR family acetate operon transcriptional repressor
MGHFADLSMKHQQADGIYLGRARIADAAAGPVGDNPQCRNFSRMTPDPATGVMRLPVGNTIVKTKASTERDQNTDDFTPAAERIQDDGGPRSPTRTLRILELVAEANGGLTMAQLSQRLNIPKTSSFSLLRPLVAQNYLVSIGKKYWLGPAMFRLTFLANRSARLGSLRPVLEKLVSDSGETAALSMIDPVEREMEYVDVVESQRSIRYVVTPGTKRPLYCVSAGLVLLAWQPQEWIDDYLNNTELKAFTASTITSKEALQKRLARVRQEGHVVNLAEFSDDVYGFAAPVFSHPGRVVAALAIGAPVARAFHKKEEYVRLLMEAAAEMSHLFQGNKPKEEP